MNQLSNISTAREIDRHRSQLLKQLNKQEHQVKKDYKQITDNLNMWRNIGYSVSNLALSFFPKIGKVTVGWSLIGKLLSIFKKK